MPSTPPNPPVAQAAGPQNPLNPMAPPPDRAAHAPPAQTPQHVRAPVAGVPGFFIVTAIEAPVFVEADDASRCVRTLPQVI